MARKLTFHRKGKPVTNPFGKAAILIGAVIAVPIILLMHKPLRWMGREGCIRTVPGRAPGRFGGYVQRDYYEFHLDGASFKKRGLGSASCKVNVIPNICPNKDCRAINAWTLVQYGRWLGQKFENNSCHPCHVDGWSEIQCRHCGIRIGGWSGRVLKGTFEDGEHEAPYNGAHGSGCRFAPRQLRIVRGDEADKTS